MAENKKMEQYKDLLEVSEETYLIDRSKIEKIWDVTEKQLKAKLKLKSGADIPDELDYIVPNIVVKRYNRIGHEGMKQHTQSEETIQYSSDDFLEYQQEIQDYLAENSLSYRRKVSFL